MRIAVAARLSPCKETVEGKTINALKLVADEFLILSPKKGEEEQEGCPPPATSPARMDVRRSSIVSDIIEYPYIAIAQF